MVLSEQSRAREEAEKKMGRLIKHMDHLERARREGEAPLLEAAYAKKVGVVGVVHKAYACLSGLCFRREGL